MIDFDINNFEKIAVYAYEQDAMLPKGIEFCEKTYKNFFDMIFPNIKITEFLLDGPTFNKNNFRYEWYRLLHKCQHELKSISIELLNLIKETPNG